MGWWSLETTGEITDNDREHIGKSIKEGFTSGEIVEDGDNV